MPEPVELPLSDPDISILSGTGSLVRRSVLPSGLRILTEHMPATASATVGFWVPVGSRDERADSFGSTHFLEHLLFKGTRTRSAFEIATAFDEVGGEHNAMTSKENTCYYAKVRDSDLPMAIDVLADMVTSSVLESVEFESERGVILEELAMADDDPGDVVGERLSELVFGDHALGRPIGGTKETIRGVSRDRVWEHYRENYTLGDLVVTIAGAIEHDTVVQLVEAALDRYGWSRDTTGQPRPRRATEVATTNSGGTTVVERPLEQVNLMIGLQGITATDDRRPTMSILNSVLGSGMSSRLFQEVRERRGLAYAVYSFGLSYADGGMFGMYAGCSPSKAGQVSKILMDQLEAIATDGISDEERARAIGMIGGASALALEDSDARMSRLGRAELSFGKFTDLEASMSQLAQVSAQDVRTFAADLLTGERSVAAVGMVETDLVRV
ncbi:pitrilysin family protein [uncultured Agrococcus sp.]|uniref:M16 family metallopeptidase n=1 Tax=uncultured Agrococcus sp. TaxID=382258 RepID=UPI0025D934A7|nr:pitrilysin family protein [uncultured Agrococcus sp.]